MSKLTEIIRYLGLRLAEPSTWQGVAFLAGLFGAKYAELNWGQAASIGATISAIIKILIPDPPVSPPPKDAP